MKFNVIIDPVHKTVTFANDRIMQFILLPPPPYGDDGERPQRENGTVEQTSIRAGKRDSPRAKRDRRPVTPPPRSHLVKSSISREKNKRAVEIVHVVVDLIERTDDDVLHIKAQTIVDKVPDLKRALEAAAKTASKNITAKKDRLLRRAFSKAWELLETQTELKAVYKNIRFPKEVPTSSRLGTTVFEFAHGGRIDLMD